MARSLRPSFLAVIILTVAGLAVGQSTPQLARDYVYGPGGRLAVTIEPDNYPPGEPSGCSASGGECQGTTIYVSWGGSGDIGSGLAYYNIYVNSQWQTTTTNTQYQENGVVCQECYTFGVSAVDNAGLESGIVYSNTICVQCCPDDALALGKSKPRKPDSALRAIMFGEKEQSSIRLDLYTRAFGQRARLLEPLLMAHARPRTTPTPFGPSRVLPRSLRASRVQVGSPRGGK